ncbi:glycoside hydrolase family protein [Roseovarius salis]|uniref:glycoside hydrolase family protein n=1 Tax=Roseovarius salis TaxID=3376063 RepID=UPI0037C4F1B5
MQMTDEGLLALAGHEGVVPAPYLDAAGVWTFGVGHTAAAGPPDPEAMPRGMPVDLDRAIAEALRIFRADVARASLTRALNAGRVEEAADLFMNWSRPAVIIPRREAERDLFLHGAYPDRAIPVWRADEGGRVDFSRPVRRLWAKEALAILRAPRRRTGWFVRLLELLSGLIRRE